MGRTKIAQSLQNTSATKKVVAGVALISGVALALVIARKRATKNRSRY